MKILHLEATNYRNYQSINFSPDNSGKYFILKANNGSGKTNLLELIYYFTYFKSFRKAADADLVKHGQKNFMIKIDFDDDGLTNQIKIIYAGRKKKYFFNDKAAVKTADLFGKFVSVIFSATDIELITGAPAERRNFFNMFFSLTDINYFSDIKHYTHILKQKNHVLKTKKNTELLSVYNQLMSQLIFNIVRFRRQKIDTIKTLFCQKYAALGDFHKQTDILYTPSFYPECFTPQNIFAFLQSKTGEELAAGFCLFGVHRDNYTFLMDGKPFAKYASFGQCRLAALVIKLIQAEFTAQIRQTTPILLFDDVILELDEKRKKNLVNSLANYGQMFITFTEDIFIDLFDKQSEIRKLDITNLNDTFKTEPQCTNEK